MVIYRIRLIVLFSFLGSSLMAQTDRYMVFFKDKIGSPHSVSSPETFLSVRSLARRALSGALVTTEDIPVTPAYVSQVHSTTAKVFFTTRWMNGVLIEASPSQVTTIQGYGFVKSVEMVAPGSRLLGGRKKTKGSVMSSSSVSTSNAAQLKMLGIDAMKADGFNGDNVWIGVMDSGFPSVDTDPAFQNLRDQGHIEMTKDFVTNSGNVYQFYEHGTNVLSIMTALINGSFEGGALNAHYLLFATEDYDTEFRVEEYNWLFAAELADSAGVDIIQSSLGYNLFDDSSMDYGVDDLDGQTTVIARAAGMARDRGMMVVTSAGNEGSSGWHYIASPADADGVLAVGAVDSEGVKAPFSSFGPTADERIKPDVAAWGVGNSVVLSNGTIGAKDGTSLAAPLVTSLLAGLRQAYPNLKPQDLIQVIKSSASQSEGPDNNLGFGIPHYKAVKNYLSAVNQESWVSVYPNPATNSCFLNFNTVTEENIELSFYDLMGRQRFTAAGAINWQNNPLEIGIATLPAGVYILRLNSSSHQASLRFVKL